MLVVLAPLVVAATSLVVELPLILLIHTQERVEAGRVQLELIIHLIRGGMEELVLSIQVSVDCWPLQVRVQAVISREGVVEESTLREAGQPQVVQGEVARVGGIPLVQMELQTRVAEEVVVVVK